MAKEQKDIVVGLDIGTAKIMAVVAEKSCLAASSSSPASGGAEQRPQAWRGGHRRHRGQHPAGAQRKPS